jgi:hypothetical protein
METTTRTIFINSRKFAFRLSVLAAAYAFICGINNADAQTSMAIGPKAGFSVTSFTGNPNGTVSTTSVGLGGLFVNFHFLEFLALQPELLIHRKGADYIANNVKTEVHINYFEVPILLKVMIPIEKHMYPHFFAGPTFSYNMSSTYSSTDTQSGRNVINKGDVGGVAGAGIDFEWDHVYLNLDGRYGIGFNTIGNTANLNIKNNNLTFMIGLGYRIGTTK